MKKILFAVFTAVCVFTCVSCSKENDTLLEDVNIPEETTTAEMTAEEKLNAKMMANDWEDIVSSTIKIHVYKLIVMSGELQFSGYVKKMSWDGSFTRDWSDTYSVKVKIDNSDFVNQEEVNYKYSIVKYGIPKKVIFGVFDSNNELICTKTFDLQKEVYNILGNWSCDGKIYTIKQDGSIYIGNSYYSLWVWYAPDTSYSKNGLYLYNGDYNTAIYSTEGNTEYLDITYSTGWNQTSTMRWTREKQETTGMHQVTL